MKRGWAAVLLLSGLCTAALHGQEKSVAAAEVVAGVVKAAEQLIATLDKAQQEKLLFAFDDQEQRKRWSNLPVTIVARRGLRMGDLNEEQQAAVYALLKATLSERGYRQVLENMVGDEVLKEQGQGRGRTMFGKGQYYVSFLGKPSTTEPWMWQFGGHHLGINATIVGDKITLSPSLTGGQPVRYNFQGKSVRQLAREQDLSFELIGALTPEQRKQTIRKESFDDALLFGPGREGIKPKEEGIKASTLNEKQRKLLLDLINERVGVLNDIHSKPLMEAIAKDLDRTWFSWHGSTIKGEPACFRIQGPTVLIEYAPQHMGGDATQHTHAMYRDPTNDYGAGWITKK